MLYVHYNFIKVLWFPHYVRLKQFTGFNPLLIPRYQITLRSLPLFLPILYSFWRLQRGLHKFSLSVLTSKYPQAHPIVYIHYNFIKVLWFPHYMRLRQFTCFNPLLIPRYQITLRSLPLFLPIPYFFWRLLRRLHKFSLSVLISK